MSNRTKVILLWIVIGVYILSPIDLIPGCVVDDLVVLLIGLLNQRKISVKARA